MTTTCLIGFPLAAGVVAVADGESGDSLTESNARTVYVYVVEATTLVSEDASPLVTSTSLTPSRYTRYPTTPSGSLDAVQVRSIRPALTAVAVNDDGAVGTVVSAGVVTLTAGLLWAEWFPDVSYASTVYWYVLAATTPPSVYPGVVVVPIAAPSR